MTYNILDGGIGREQQIADVLKATSPDIVILQEVYQPELLQDLGKSIGAEAYFGAGKNRRHVALLSRFPIVTCHSYYRFPPIWRNGIKAEIEYQPGRRIHILGIHPMANLALPFEFWRWWEAQHNTRLAKESKSEPCLIAGDLNAIAPGDSVDIQSMPRWLKWAIFLQGNRLYRFSIRAYQKAGFTDSFRYLNPQETGYTLPPPCPNARLDYILVNGILCSSLQRCYVVNNHPSAHKASDHYPVVAEFEV
jgi:exonuclease III